ncbi:hypothetical protein HanRHA438_Chr03g0102801 [Helianthus annuus]|uniref:Uncharacterized protein n=1 Tax=Helianthus annuus TaxID=4232 RepID=A0A251V408_HELAN|nr:putative UPF0481 protein At3g02645 [Helianthus annuus]KAF5812866.1 hypothetical protein HanXRQr2_Chr03g0091491 [Helianthus annuus]KAJ0606680.1 hypothetical protein HanHA89_Chr03g0087891 [Helianthus annuus]KAJ0934029.1 hypothetical protein HanRHA438_Chr03g0102801 [Helianthus annuus]
MVPSISSSPSSIDNPQWVFRISKTFETHLQVDTDLPICIFQVPETLITENRESYVPKCIGLGPIHHFHTDLYSNQEQLKLATAKTALTPYKIASHFEKTVIENLKQLVPEVRCCYDSYFDVDDDMLAWVFAIDGVFLIDILSKVSEGNSLETFEDIVKVENQIPLLVLIETRSVLDKHLSGHCNNSFLSNMMVRICETRSPLKFSKRISRLDLDINNRFHLLDCMYHLIVNNNVNAKNQCLRPNFLDDVDLEDVENAVQMASDICPGASAFLQPLLIILKLPWDKIISLVKKMLGENPAVLEIDIPSASELSNVGKVEFCMTPGGIRDVEFDDETHTFYLPILRLKPDSEVILRNLVAYEGLMFKKGTFSNLDFTEYVDLMCGIIDSAKDVHILREKHIIEGELDDDEIAKLFNGISKSPLKTEEASGLQQTVARVNKYYGNVPRVKVYHFIKKYVLAWWKVIAVVFTLVNLMLLVVQGACQVYECNNGLGFGVVRLLFHVGTEKDLMFEFERT